MQKINTEYNTNNHNSIDLILEYINDLKNNKIPSYPLRLKGTEHESIIKELNGLIISREETKKEHQSEIEHLISKKEEAQNAEKEHIQFMLSLAQNILNPLNGILGFVDLLVNSTKDLAENEKQKYYHFMKQGELTLLQNIDYISSYAHIMSETTPGIGYFRTKHLLNEVYKEFTNKIMPKFAGDRDIEIRTNQSNADLFIQINENSLKIIWLVVIEFMTELFKKQIITLEILAQNNSITLRSIIEKNEFLRKEEINAINNFMPAADHQNIYKTHLSIPLFIAQKQLKLLNGEYKTDIYSKNIVHIDIIIPLIQ
jgi:light-regulated signal transduction histidine kinase (bacteriophytochrome)